MSELNIPQRKSLDAMLWSIRIFAKYAEYGLNTPAELGVYRDQIYAPVTLDTIPEDSMDGELLSAYGWVAMDDSWVWLT